LKFSHEVIMPRQARIQADRHIVIARWMEWAKTLERVVIRLPGVFQVLE
jgi:hypothetical protein